MSKFSSNPSTKMNPFIDFSQMSPFSIQNSIMTGIPVWNQLARVNIIAKCEYN